MFLTKLPLFGDEALYCYLGYQFNTQPVREAWNLTVNHWGDAPGLIILNAISLAILTNVGPVTACRMTAVIVSAFGALALASLMKLLGAKKGEQLAGTLFLLLNPFSFFFDRTSLMDPVATAWGIGWIYWSLKYLKQGKLLTLLLSWFWLVLAFISKTNALLLLPVVVILVLGDRKLFKFRKEYFIGTGILVTGLMWWFYRFTTVWQTVFYHVGQTSPWNNLRLMGSWYWQFLTPLSLLLLILGVKRILSLGFMAAVYALISGRLFPRYLLLTLPFMALIIGFSAKTKAGKILLLGLLILFLVRDYQILVKPAEAKLAKETHFEYFEDWGSGIGTKAALEYLQRTPEPKLLLAPTDLTGLVFIGHLEYAPRLNLSINYFKDEQELRRLIKQKNAWVMTTTHHDWVKQVIERTIPDYATNGKARNSVELYRLTNNEDFK